MIRDAIRSFRRERDASIASLAILAATALGAAAAACAAPAPAPRSVQVKPVGAAGLDGSSGAPQDEVNSFQHHMGDGSRLRVRVVGHVLFDDRAGTIRELPGGSSVLIETDGLGQGSQRMLITEEQGEPRYAWWLSGDARPVDADAQAWLKEALEVFAAYRAIGDIRGLVGSLEGQIGSIQGQIGALQGRIGSIHGEEGSLQGKIGSIHGERGSLQGKIGSHLGAIGTLQAARVSASADLVRQIDAEIEEHEVAIRKLEAELQGGNLARRLAEAEAELRAFQQGSRSKILELERQIAAIHSEQQIEQLEQEIEDVHAEERIDEIERRVAPAVERLRALMSQLGS